jgi:tRNA-2-methylthio-N6-dimethylallyladenosine synthase
MKKVFIETFGCQMNVADSEYMLSELLKRGFVPTDEKKKADLIIVNTCTVREHAHHKAISYLGRLKVWKSQKPGRKIIFAGCAAQLENKIPTKLSHIDFISKSKDIDNFSKLLDSDEFFANEDFSSSALANAKAEQFVTIMRGCNFQCSYCIVPSVRGKEIHLSPKEILSDIQSKVKHGAKKVMLLGQTVNSYRHKDCKSFSELLKRVCKVPQIELIEFMSPHPLFFTDELIETISKSKKISRYIHLPIQSGSTKILKLMKRGYTRKFILDTIEKLKSKIPNIRISTDFIVGFPGETQKDFKETLSLVKKLGLVNAFCFKYSPRKGTTSCNMKGEISELEKEKRLNALLSLVKQTLKKFKCGKQ